MEGSDTKWLAIGMIGIFLAAWIGGAIIASAKCAVERSAMENGYVQKRVGDDLLWVKE